MPSYYGRDDELSTRPLGMDGLGDAPALIQLPNGIAIDPAALSSHLGIPAAAIIAAATGVRRARSLAEGQTFVDRVEAAYGLAPNALDAIAASMRPVVVVQRGMAGLTDWASAAWDKAVDVGKEVVGVAADTSAVALTGGASLLLPGELQPGNAVTDPGGWVRGIKTEAAPAVFDGAKWIAQSLGTLSGKTLLTAGGLLKNFNQAVPPPAAPVRQASIFGGNLTPWLIGGGILAAVLLSRKGHST